MEEYIIGIDVGGTKTAYGIYDKEKNLVRSLNHKSETELTSEAFFDSIAANIKELMTASLLEKRNILGIGLGMPSFIV